MSEIALASGLMWPSTFLHVNPTNCVRRGAKTRARVSHHMRHRQ